MVLVRLPNTDHKGRRFHCNTTLQSKYDFVDSLGLLEVGSMKRYAGLKFQVKEPRFEMEKSKISDLKLPTLLVLLQQLMTVNYIYFNNYRTNAEFYFEYE